MCASLTSKQPFHKLYSSCITLCCHFMNSCKALQRAEQPASRSVACQFSWKGGQLICDNCSSYPQKTEVQPSPLLVLQGMVFGLQNLELPELAFWLQEVFFSVKKARPLLSTVRAMVGTAMAPGGLEGASVLAVGAGRERGSGHLKVGREFVDSKLAYKEVYLQFSLKIIAHLHVELPCP